ncbi:hypothetical protein [Methanoculleus chikugoensis]|uniref:hypothetical protein n=1 Tax=Methanoculleus chikugoensis TaxID=118126 RepID=UPI001FB254A0|nr:hypothetical protein [Methanoculleus chikugoensis]
MVISACACRNTTPRVKWGGDARPGVDAPPSPPTNAAQSIPALPGEYGRECLIRVLMKPSRSALPPTSVREGEGDGEDAFPSRSWSS